MARVDRAHFQYPGQGGYEERGEEQGATLAEWNSLSKEVGHLGFTLVKTFLSAGQYT